MLPRLSWSASDRKRAIAILRGNLDLRDDLIVTNLTLEALTEFAAEDPALRRDLVAVLRGHLSSEHKSLASRARRLLATMARQGGPK